MYRIYSTEAFVIRENPSSEESKFVYVFTESLGLVLARVQAGKSLKSKMRHHLAPLSKVSLSLVRGREFWRIIGADNSEHFFLLPFENRAALARVFRLVERLVHGEEESKELFFALNECSTRLKRATSPEERLLVETIAVGKILRSLGYLSPDQAYQELFGEGEISVSGKSIPRSLIRDINKALRSTGL